MLAELGRMTTAERHYPAEHGERGGHPARGSLEVMCDREYDSRPVSPLSGEPVAHASAYFMVRGRSAICPGRSCPRCIATATQEIS